MADSLREEIRACIREELQNVERSSNNQVSNQSLVARTRSLINASASSASQALSNSESPRLNSHGRSPDTSQNRNSTTANTPILSGSKRCLPSHPLRFSGKKSKQKVTKTVTAQIVPKTVYLVDNLNVSHDADDVTKDDYSLTESMILVKGECDLKSTYSEEEIRLELTNLFKVKLPLITNKDFDFVRRERNTITTPVVKPDHQWDFKHVKHLCGQGKLYVRLNVIKDILTEKEEREEDFSDSMPEDEIAIPRVEPEVEIRNVGINLNGIPVILDEEPSTSAGTSFFDNGLASLTSIFPDEDASTIRDALFRYEDVMLAAEALSNNVETSSVAKVVNESAADVLERLKEQMDGPGSAEKLKVDEEDLPVDFFQYYKSKKFDPKVPIKVQMRGQPAIDSGGVLRQAFSTMFSKLARNELLGLKLFAGPSHRLTPMYSSDCILAGVFEIIGRMISHSMVQDGPGFPCLAPAVYSYISTGSLTEAIMKVSVVDIADSDLLGFVEKIRDAPSTMMSEVIAEVAKELSFIFLMQECGDMRIITVENRLDVLQTLILHNAIIKHKAALDQLREGLSVLGLLHEIEKDPDKFKKYFVHEEENISASYVKGLLKIDDASKDKIQVQMLFSFIENTTKEKLAALLAFLTGSGSCIESFSTGCIKVSVEDIEGFFASTCILLFNIPSHIESYSQFESNISAVLKGTRFTTV